MLRLASAIILLLATAGTTFAQNAGGVSPLLVASATATAPDTAAVEAGGPGLFPRPLAEAAEIAYLQRELKKRPRALIALYVTVAGLNVMDAVSTTGALGRGAREVNPLMARTSGHLGVSLAIKGATTAATIFFAERLWKNNRAAAIVTMVAVNAGTAAIVATNVRNARRLR